MKHEQKEILHCMEDTDLNVQGHSIYISYLSKWVDNAKQNNQKKPTPIKKQQQQRGVKKKRRRHETSWGWGVTRTYLPDIGIILFARVIVVEFVG